MTTHVERIISLADELKKIAAEMGGAPDAPAPSTIPDSVKPYVLANWKGDYSDPNFQTDGHVSVFVVGAASPDEAQWAELLRFGSGALRVFSSWAGASHTTIAMAYTGEAFPAYMELPPGNKALVEFSAEEGTVFSATGVKAFLNGVEQAHGATMNFKDVGTLTGLETGNAKFAAEQVIITKPMPKAQIEELRSYLMAAHGIGGAVPAPAPAPEPVEPSEPAPAPTDPVEPAPSPTPAPTAGDPREGKALAFDEEFTAINTTRWNAGPKPTTWDSGHFGWFKFVSSWDGEDAKDASGNVIGRYNPFSIVDASGAADGKALRIGAKWMGDKMVNAYGTVDQPASFLSGLISTVNFDPKTKAITNYTGFDVEKATYYVCRMKVPNSRYTWPAFWLMNKASILQPDVYSYEVDIIEHKGEEVGYGAYVHPWLPTSDHHGTGVWLSASKGPVSYDPGDAVDLRVAFHDYGFMLANDTFTLYVDHKPVRNQAGDVLSWPFSFGASMRQRGDTFYPIVNLAGLPIEKNGWMPPSGEIELLVDSVKVYR